MELFTEITHTIAHFGIGVLEIAAMGILLFGSGKTIWMLICHKPHITLSATRFMNIALILMLSAEIIRLVTVRTPLELGIVAGLVVLHGGISYLIAWEVNREEKHDKEREKDKVSDQEDVLL